MAELFEMENFDSYKEDNRREVKKSRRRTSKQLMGNLFCLCQLLWRSYHSWRKRR